MQPASISEFIAAHNNHAVSTENNQTPAQMFYLNLTLTAFHGGFPENVTWRGVSVNRELKNHDDGLVDDDRK